MITIEQAVHDYLLEDGAVVAALGDRVYQTIIPQGLQGPEFPAARISTVTCRDAYTHDGDAGHGFMGIQIDVFADYGSGLDWFLAASDPADVIHARLSGAKWFVGSPAELEITGARRTNRQVLFEADPREARVILDYDVGFRRL